MAYIIVSFTVTCSILSGPGMVHCAYNSAIITYVAQIYRNSIFHAQNRFWCKLHPYLFDGVHPNCVSVTNLLLPMPYPSHSHLRTNDRSNFQRHCYSVSDVHLCPCVCVSAVYTTCFFSRFCLNIYLIHPSCVSNSINRTLTNWTYCAP